MVGVNTYVKLSKRQRDIVLCIMEKLGHRSISETIRYLIDLGINSLNQSIVKPCMEKKQ